MLYGRQKITDTLEVWRGRTGFEVVISKLHITLPGLFPTKDQAIAAANDADAVADWHAVCKSVLTDPQFKAREQYAGEWLSILVKHGGSKKIKARHAVDPEKVKALVLKHLAR